jgi:hypothetical protein
MASSTSTVAVVHHGVRCNICRQNAIVGVRTFCVTCGDFDLCEACAATGTDHPPAHLMKQFATPEATDVETGEQITDANFAVGKMPYGRRWEGRFKGGLPHGRGKKFYPDGTRYEGEVFNGRKEGEGTFFSANGNRYEGQWKNDKKEGLGTVFFLDTPGKDERYEGQWKNNRREGEGHYFFADGRRFEGASKNHAFNGFGTMFYPDGRRWAGQWRDAKKVKEEGQWFDADSSAPGTSSSASTSLSGASQVS